MALIFSYVTVESGRKKTRFWTGGVPRELNDLRGWNVFEDFLKGIKKKTEVRVRVIVYRYGEGENYDANTYEVADFQQRIEKRPSFIESNCTIPCCFGFGFEWPQEEAVQDKLPFVET